MNIEDIKVGYKLSDKNEFKLVRGYIANHGYSTLLFDKHLSTLVIEEDMNKIEVSNKSKYDPFLNKVCGKGSKDHFIHELFHMASNNDELMCNGIRNSIGFGASLNEGITDYLTQFVSLTYNVHYFFEVLFYESLNFMFPDCVEEGLDCYFLGRPSKYYDLFNEDKGVIVKAVLQLDNYSKNIKYKLDKGKLVSCTNDNGDNAFDYLTNAFSTIINLCLKKDKKLALELKEYFIDTVNNKINEIEGAKIIDLIESKIEEVPSL